MPPILCSVFLLSSRSIVEGGLLHKSVENIWCLLTNSQNLHRDERFHLVKVLKPLNCCLVQNFAFFCYFLTSQKILPLAWFLRIPLETYLKCLWQKLIWEFCELSLLFDREPDFVLVSREFFELSNFSYRSFWFPLTKAKKETLSD